jgi:predicted NBD/HSP70 family sugar kinase
LVLNLIKSGPTSRAEIAQETGLSPATVSNLTAELLGEGLVQETGVVGAQRGRPRVLLRLNSQARYVVGIKVMPTELVAVVTDLDANVVASRTTTTADASGSPDVFIDQLARVVDAVVDDAGISRSDLLGVGIGLAGIVDAVAGVARYSPFLGWRDLDLVTPLRDRLGLDVQLANDVDSLTIAEQWFGHGRGLSDVVVVTIGRGIGAGFVLNGRFYGGRHGGVGEFAHTPVAPAGPRCSCGRQGCLEALASDVAVIAAADEAVARGRDTALRDADHIDLAAIVRAADDGDAYARELLAESGRWLGVGVATLINLLNPQRVIVAGEGVEAGAWRFDPMRAAIEESRFDAVGAETEIIVESTGDITWARGAACVVLGEFFKSPLHRDRPATSSTAS